MSVWLMECRVIIDDPALARHDGEQSAPPNDPEEWYGGDLVAALDKGIAELEHDELERVELVSDEDGD